MKSKAFAWFLLLFMLMTCFSSFADGGLFGGRIAHRRAMRRAACQAAHQMSCGNQMAVVQHNLPVAASQCQSNELQQVAISMPATSFDVGEQCACGPGCQCGPLQPQTIEYIQSAYHEPGVTYEPTVTYPPATYSDIDKVWRQPGAGSFGQCRLVNGQWQCGS